MQEFSLMSDYPLVTSDAPKRMEKELTIFIVDDNIAYLEMMKQTLSQNPSYDVYSFSNWKECISNLYRKPDLVIVDYYLEEENPDGKNGRDVLENIKEKQPQTEVAIISKDKRIELMSGLLHNGAKDLIVKDKEALHHIREVAHNILIDKQVKTEWEILGTIFFGIIIFVLIFFTIIILVT